VYQLGGVEVVQKAAAAPERAEAKSVGNPCHMRGERRAHVLFESDSNYLPTESEEKLHAPLVLLILAISYTPGYLSTNSTHI
jgi:hypothetical protein